MYLLKHKLHFIRSTNKAMYYGVIFFHLCHSIMGCIVQYLFNQGIEILKMNFFFTTRSITTEECH